MGHLILLHAERMSAGANMEEKPEIQIMQIIVYFSFTFTFTP